MKDNNRGKPTSIKTEQAGMKQLLLFVTDTCITLEQDPQKRVQLLSAKAMLDGGTTDTGWFSSASEASGEEADGTP